MKFSVIVIAFAFMASCKSTSKHSFDTKSETDLIQREMDEQQDAWNNHDLQGFMKWYWNSDSLTFIGSKGLNYGWNKTLANYQKSYPSPEAMGRLQFTNLNIRILDSENAYVIGKWELFRTDDTLSGHYSLLWKKMGQSWFIVADHSS